MPKPRSRTPDAPATPERKVLYPDFGIEAYRDATKNPMTATRAKELVGWEEVDDRSKATLTDRNGKAIRLARNGRNRPFYSSLADGYSQEQLRRRWRLNGETMIFDEYGDIISCVHRLVGLVLAEQDRTGPNKEYWRKFWDGPVTIECIVVTGIKATDEIADTVDRGKSRSDADVLFRGPWFADKPDKERRSLAKVAANAVKFLFKRTGLDRQVLAGHKINRSAPEITGFINRHPSIVRAVKHVVSEDGDSRISRYVPLGVAAGLLYLMAASGSDPVKYRSDTGQPSEENLDLSMQDKADEFFVCFGNRTVEDLKALHYAESPFEYTDEAGKRATRSIHTMSDESTGEWRLATICKAWTEFSLGNKVTAEKLVLPFKEDIHGMPEMIGGVWATVGGVDVGEPVETEEEEDKGEDPPKKPARPAKPGKPAAEEGPVPASQNQLLDELRKQYDGAVLFFKAGASGWKVFGQDVDAVHKAGGTIRTRGKVDKMPYGTMYVTDVDPNIGFMTAKGHKAVKVLGPSDVVVVDPAGDKKVEKVSRKK